jgi:hypothetical protein
VALNGLDVYVDRICLDLDERRTGTALCRAAVALRSMAAGWYTPEMAEQVLVELGERAAPHPDEGTPCG